MASVGTLPASSLRRYLLDLERKLRTALFLVHLSIGFWKLFCASFAGNVFTFRNICSWSIKKPLNLTEMHSPLKSTLHTLRIWSWRRRRALYLPCFVSHVCLVVNYPSCISQQAAFLRLSLKSSPAHPPITPFPFPLPPPHFLLRSVVYNIYSVGLLFLYSTVFLEAAGGHTAINNFQTNLCFQGLTWKKRGESSTRGMRGSVPQSVWQGILLICPLSPQSVLVTPSRRVPFQND